MKKFSLKAVCPELSKILGENIYFEPNNIKNLSRDHFNQVFKKNNIILLENIRFYKEEEDFNIKFIEKLSSLETCTLMNVFHPVIEITIDFRYAKIFTLLSRKIT